MTKVSAQIRLAVRFIVIIVLLALAGGMIGTIVGRLALGADPIVQPLTVWLSACCGFWGLVLLIGMVLTARGGMGEYFWLWSPIITASALGIWLTIRYDADFLSVVAYSALGSLALYGTAVSLHILIRNVFRLRSA